MGIDGGRGVKQIELCMFGCLCVRVSLKLVCVCLKLYLLQQRTRARCPVLQLDNGDKVGFLTFILTGVAQRQRVVLKQKDNTGGVRISDTRGFVTGNSKLPQWSSGLECLPSNW